MKTIEKLIQNLNFKKIIRLYVVFAIITAILAVSFLGYAFKDKLGVAYNYTKLIDKIEDGELGINTINDDIIKLANQSSDIVDVLILDKDNNIIFSAKNSEFVDGGEFILEQEQSKEYSYLTYSKNPDVTFRLMKDDELMLSTFLFDNEREIENDHDDHNFFEDNFTSKKIYLLNYLADKSTGDKIYFISDVHPVPNTLLYIEIVGAVLTLYFMFYWVFVALWVFQDARKSKSNAVLWGIITLVTNLAGLFIYIIYKQSNQICFKCGAIQNKGNIYCIQCGTKISKNCKECKEIINRDDSFCSHCGNIIDIDKKSE